MKRREAIRNIALASTFTMFITSCADKNVVEFLVDGKLNLNQKHKDYLGVISETILPISKVADRVPDPVDFILTMVNDCSPKEDLVKFVDGFEQYKLLMKENSMKIKTAKPQETIDLIESVYANQSPSEELILFVSKVQELSTYNLLTSEYYKTEIEDYKMIPDTYQACVEVQKL